MRIPLDRLHPQYAPPKPLDSSQSFHPFIVGDKVYTRNYGGPLLWELWGSSYDLTGYDPGKVIGVTGPCCYKVEIGQGKVWRRHQDQLRSRWGEEANLNTSNESQEYWAHSPAPSVMSLQHGTPVSPGGFHMVYPRDILRRRAGHLGPRWRPTGNRVLRMGGPYRKPRGTPKLVETGRNWDQLLS